MNKKAKKANAVNLTFRSYKTNLMKFIKITSIPRVANPMKNKYQGLISR